MGRARGAYWVAKSATKSDTSSYNFGIRSLGFRLGRYTVEHFSSTGPLPIRDNTGARLARHQLSEHNHLEQLSEMQALKMSDCLYW